MKYFHYFRSSLPHVIYFREEIRHTMASYVRYLELQIQNLNIIFKYYSMKLAFFSS